ncbi:MAG: insulinase family protein [Bacteroidia bacterium]|nr:MAG: insulinase family protein [Bacteroidia bacterium]
MVKFHRHILSNGLRVLVHRDETTPLAAVNILYDVGARDEHPERTGFAHLFEHLMFEGSANVPRFDYELQHAGGENNAFTTNDITNYYLSLPAQNLETAFWLESDRMLALAFSSEKLLTQQNVVTEEYRQSYLNQPYGDAWLLMRPLAYDVHPYRWATIGKDISHIRDATLQDVKDFFHTYYHPANAILTVTGNVEESRVFELAEKWFGDIPPGPLNIRKLPPEPLQKKEKRLSAKRDVPQHQIYMTFHMCARNHPDFHTADLISDMLANGESSRLPARLLHDQKVFSEVNAYVTGNLDPGLLVIAGKPHLETDPAEAEDMLWKEAYDLVANAVTERELQKVKNRVEASQTYSESNVMAKAMNLAYYELQGDAGLYNKQIENYQRVKAEDIQRVAGEIFRRDNLSVLHYGNSGTVK